MTVIEILMIKMLVTAKKS